MAPSTSLRDGRAFVSVSPDALSLDELVSFVSDPGAGAIGSFTGVTRDNFNGKRVLKLDYEAYEPMAAKEMMRLCKEAMERFDVLKIAVSHRVGEVRVGQASVIIVASSAHRRPSLEACHWYIDNLKAVVPIWKREFYEDGEVWKENAAADLTKSTQRTLVREF